MIRLSKETIEYATNLLSSHFELVSVFQKCYAIDKSIIYEANFIAKNIAGESNKLFEVRITEEQFNKLKTLMCCKNKEVE